MLIDARSLSAGVDLVADVCIVGAGAAGITLARELRSIPLDICLLESGNLGYEPETQSLYEGASIGIEYWPLSASRVRFLGGTTNHWGGVCLPLDEDDFEPRPWANGSGWPFPKSHLEPYYHRAIPLLRIGRYAFGAEDWLPEQHTPLPLDPERVVTEVAQISRARFGIDYRNELDKAKNLQVFLHANVVDIETSPAADRVHCVHVASLQGPRFTVTARMFILAMGGIENARLLLLSDGAAKSGLGNQHDLVGRHFADHPYFPRLADLSITNPRISMAAYTEHDDDRRSAETVDFGTFLKLTPAMRKRSGLLNSRLYVQPVAWTNLSTGPRTINQLRRAILGGRVKLDALGGDLLRIIQDLDGVATAAYENVSGGRLFSIGGWTETIPNPDSRVRLGERRDALGQRQVVLDWRIGQQEKESMVRTLEILGAEIGRAGIGRLRLNFDPESPMTWDERTNSTPHPGLHHMGTTRMHRDPRQGVVDAHCRVHGVENLFIAGSSVFPTYGHANPTFTIAALAIRLADHLKSLFRGEHA